MDVREKLVELLSAGCCPDDGCDFCDYVDFEGCRPHFLADHLIANGVTVQEWIPSYNYPKETGFYNCYYKTPDSNLWRVGMCYWNDTNWIQVGFMPVAVQVMFWMPLPPPPKGE